MAALRIEAVSPVEEKGFTKNNISVGDDYIASFGPACSPHERILDETSLSPDCVFKYSTIKWDTVKVDFTTNEKYLLMLYDLLSRV